MHTLFADAQLRFPKPQEKWLLSAVIVFQTGPAGQGGETRPRETGFPVLGRRRACDTGPWQLVASQGERGAPLCLGRSQAGERPREGLPGAGAVDEDRAWVTQHVQGTVLGPEHDLLAKALGSSRAGLIQPLLPNHRSVPKVLGSFPEMTETGRKFLSLPPDVPPYLCHPPSCSEESRWGETGLGEPRHRQRRAWSRSKVRTE